MNNQFNLNIKTPCQENFNDFTPTSNGGFCSSCQTEVIDFTKMNSQEIINYFKTKNTQNTCGKFNVNQLKTYHSNIQKRRRFSLLSGIGLAFLSLFLVGTAQAQDTKNQSDNSDKNTTEVQDVSQEKNITVKGTITDENGLALPGANIVLEGTPIGIATDFDGNFEFPEKLKKGDVLTISYIGYEAKKVVINSDDSALKIEMKVNMQMDSCVILGKVAVKQVYKSKRN